MSKFIELIGFACIAGTIYAFLGLIAQQNPIGWPVFWAFASGALGVILYRQWKKKKSES